MSLVRTFNYLTVAKRNTLFWIIDLKLFYFWCNLKFRKYENKISVKVCFYYKNRFYTFIRIQRYIICNFLTNIWFTMDFTRLGYFLQFLIISWDELTGFDQTADVALTRRWPARLTTNFDQKSSYLDGKTIYMKVVDNYILYLTITIIS